jgi:broad specificity phosphatase PhoE
MRHGESAFNRHFDLHGTDPGLADPPLTSEGHRQARAAAVALAGEPITRIICSPYTRSLQTAAPLAEAFGLPVEVSALVRERYCASCDIGSPRSILTDAWPHIDFRAIAEVWWPPAEELFAQLAARAAIFRVSLDADPASGQTLVVCHWGFITALAGRSLRPGEWMRIP